MPVDCLCHRKGGARPVLIPRGVNLDDVVAFDAEPVELGPLMRLALPRHKLCFSTRWPRVIAFAPLQFERKQLRTDNERVKCLTGEHSCVGSSLLL